MNFPQRQRNKYALGSKKEASLRNASLRFATLRFAAQDRRTKRCMEYFFLSPLVLYILVRKLNQCKYTAFLQTALLSI